MRSESHISKERISSTQLGMLLFLMISATTILFLPGMIARQAQQSAWRAPIFACIPGLIILFIISRLGKRFPRLSLPQYSEIVLGKLVGKVFSGFYVLYFFMAYILIAREFSEFLANTALIGTPVPVLNLAIVLVSWYSAKKGIEVITRMTQFVLPLFILILVTMFCLAIPGADWANLLPVFESGLSPVMHSSFTVSAWYGEIIVLVMLLPFVNEPKEISRKVVWTLLSVAVFLSFATLITLSVLGPNVTGTIMFPFWYLAKCIEYKNYIQRVEGFVVPLWIMGMVIKAALFYFLGCLASAQVLGLKSYRSALIPSAFITMILSNLLFGSTLKLNMVLENFWPPFAIVFELALPAFLLATASLRKKQQGVSNET